MDGDRSDLFLIGRVHDLHIEIAFGGVHHFKIGVVVHSHIERGIELLDVTSHGL